MGLLNWIDTKFFGVRRLLSAGVELPERPARNLGAGLVAVDNPAENRVDLSMNTSEASSESSGLMSAEDKVKLDATYGARIQETSVTITAAELSSLDPGVLDWTKVAMPPLPDGARFLALSIEDVTAFVDGAGSTVTISFDPTGGSGHIFADVQVMSSAGFPRSAASAEIYPGRALTSGAYLLTITNESGHDLREMIRGAVTVKMFWWVRG